MKNVFDKKKKTKNLILSWWIVDLYDKSRRRFLLHLLSSWLLMLQKTNQVIVQWIPMEHSEVDQDTFIFMPNSICATWYLQQKSVRWECQQWLDYITKRRSTTQAWVLQQEICDLTMDLWQLLEMLLTGAWPKTRILNWGLQTSVTLIWKHGVTYSLDFITAAVASIFAN